MNKFSIIIPTLWKSPVLLEMLDRLNESELVGEIILIENKINPEPLTHSKLIRVGLSKNIYVNPAWNMGVSIANNDLICLYSDDAFFNPNLLLENVLENSHLLGSFGVHPDSFESTKDTFNVQLGHEIGKGWGTLIFLKKSMYVPVPNSFKIWYGDNWITETAGTSYSFKFPIKSKVSTTSGSPEFQEVIKKDSLEWGRNKITITYIGGPKVEIIGEETKEYFIEFIDSDTNKVVHNSTIKNNMWTSCNRKQFTNWVIKINGEIYDVFNDRPVRSFRMTSDN